MNARTPRTGDVVDYRLSVADVARADADRTASKPYNRHYGNQPRVGDVVPLIVVRVWPDEYGDDRRISIDDGVERKWVTPSSPFGVNGQAILDGNDALWVTSAPHGDGPGMWTWPAADECQEHQPSEPVERPDPSRPERYVL